MEKTRRKTLNNLVKQEEERKNHPKEFIKTLKKRENNNNFPKVWSLNPINIYYEKKNIMSSYKFKS